LPKTPNLPTGKGRPLATEIFLVLGLSLGGSAIYSILDWLTSLSAKGGLAGTVRALNSSTNAPTEWLDFAFQLTNQLLGFAPVALVVFLLAGSLGRGSLVSIGWQKPTRPVDFVSGLALAAAIGVPGLLLYLGARAIGAAAQVVPADMGLHWWVVPMLLLSALKSAALEEFIMVGYLFNRLEAMRWSTRRQIWVSAIIRGTYHLYQGYAGFFGNIVMGLVFGWLYKKYGRLQPIVIAHFVLDAAAFLGYSVIVWCHIQL
jgi:membrane protease YdiL (CAAX protease family)